MTCEVFWCLYYEPGTNFKHSSGISILDFKQVNVNWVGTLQMCIFIVNSGIEIIVDET